MPTKNMQTLFKIDCSEMKIKFEKGTIKQIAFLNKPDGILLPIQDVTLKDQQLKGFLWKIEERPSSKTSLIH